MARITDQELRAPPSRLAGKRRFDRQRAMDYSIAMITIRSSRPGEGARVVEIWRRAVDATMIFFP